MSDAPPEVDQILSEQPQGQASHPPEVDHVLNDPQGGMMGLAEAAGQVPEEGYQAILEGAARGAIPFGLSDIALRATGTSPEALTRRAQMPGTTTAAIAGGLLSSVVPGGPIGALGKVGQAYSEVAGPALGLASEGALFGASNALSDKALGNPDLNAEKIMSNIGLSSALGFALGNTLSQGTPQGIAKEIPDEISRMNREAEQANAIRSQTWFKENAPDIQAAADRHGWPINPGQMTAKPHVEKWVDSLINGAPSIAGIQVQGAYNNAHNMVVNDLLSMRPSQVSSKFDLGQAAKNLLTEKIGQVFRPFNELYGAVQPETQGVPISPDAMIKLKTDLGRFVKTEGFGRTSPAYQMAGDIPKDLEGIENIGQLIKYQTGLNQAYSPAQLAPAQRRLLGIVQDKIDTLLKGSIADHANQLESMIPGIPEGSGVDPQGVQNYVNGLRTLNDRVDLIDQQYAPLRQKISDLGSWLGQKNIYGPRHAQQVIENLEPEDLAQKLSSTKYANLISFMDQNYPEVGALLKNYQKENLISQAFPGGKSFSLGEFNPKTFIKKVGNLEPEIRNTVFNPQETQLIGDASKYLGSFPRNFNPSGTSGMAATRQFMSNPISGLIGNVRDWITLKGIQMNGIPEALRPSPQALGHNASIVINHLLAAKNLSDRTDKKVQENLDYIMKGEDSGP